MTHGRDPSDSHEARARRAQAGPHLRVACWNVHGAVGLDGRRNVDRIADVLRDLAVDVAMLQELDVARARSAGVDQPSAIALRLGWSHVFGAAIREGDAGYGNVIMSKEALGEPRTYPLPSEGPGEPRAVTRAELETRIGKLELAVTHLGLRARDREAQLGRLRASLGPATLPRLLCGDFNARPGDSVFQVLREMGLTRVEGGKTFPSFLPLLQIDHVWLDPRLRALDVEHPSCRAIRASSDHLPIVVTLAVQHVP
jgi:endonuclease/exonuclease/phosphatase family metal-dependent hydrolase